MRDKRLIDMRTDIALDWGKEERETGVDADAVIMMLKPHHSWIARYISTFREGGGEKEGQICQGRLVSSVNEEMYRVELN